MVGPLDTQVDGPNVRAMVTYTTIITHLGIFQSGKLLSGPAKILSYWTKCLAQHPAVWTTLL